MNFNLLFSFRLERPKTLGLMLMRTLVYFLLTMVLPKCSSIQSCLVYLVPLVLLLN